MELFGFTRKCSKCNLPRLDNIVGEGIIPFKLKYRDAPTEPKECIVVTCPRCGYSFWEHCADMEVK
jgi:hypothetical protein